MHPLLEAGGESTSSMPDPSRSGDLHRRRVLQGIGVAVTGAVGGCGDRAGDSTPSPRRSTTETGHPADGSTTPTRTPTSDPDPPSTPTGTPRTTLRNGSFESELEGWAVGADLPEDPENPGHPVEARATPSTARSAHGERSLELFVDGRQDDGTVWVQQLVDLTDVETLAVTVHSPGRSFNTITEVAAYAGPAPEKTNQLTESDFDTRKAIENHEGWAVFEYTVDTDGSGLVAVGINVVWETTVTRYLDRVTVW